MSKKHVLDSSVTVASVRHLVNTLRMATMEYDPADDLEFSCKDAQLVYERGLNDGWRKMADSVVAMVTEQVERQLEREFTTQIDNDPLEE